MRFAIFAALMAFSIQALAEKQDVAINCSPVGGMDAPGGLNRASISGVVMVDEDDSAVGALDIVIKRVGQASQVQIPMVQVTGKFTSQPSSTTSDGTIETLVFRGDDINSPADRKISLISLSNLKTASAQSALFVDGVKYFTNCRFE